MAIPVSDRKRPVHPQGTEQPAQPEAGRGGDDRARAKAAFERLKALRKGTTLGDVSWKELRDCGRR
jgi:hypothetical protein